MDNFYSIFLINRNMRCIEIPITDFKIGLKVGINRNMRCIEISGYLAKLRCRK